MKRLAMTWLYLIIMVSLFGCSDNSATKGGNDAANLKNNGAIPLAQEFPEDFPLIEGKITASMKTDSVDAEQGEPVGTGTYTQMIADMTPEQAMSFYKPKFSKIVKQTPLNKKGETAMYSGFVNKHPVSIYFVDQKGKTLLTIVISGGKR